MANSIKLTRNQIAKIVGGDVEAIKTFEKLISLTSDYLETGLVDDINIAAGSAGAGVAGLAGAVQALADAIERQPPAIGASAINGAVQALECAPSPASLANVDARLHALETAPSHTPELRRYSYGTFYDTTTQTAAAINTAYAITVNTTGLSNGVTVGTPASRIYVDRSNVYNFQFSLQLNKASASIGRVFIWARVNGSDIASSATEVSLSGSSAALVAAWNFVLDLRANDYFELMWSTDHVDCQIVSVASVSPVPGIPSVILTVTDNIRA